MDDKKNISGAINIVEALQQLYSIFNVFMHKEHVLRIIWIGTYVSPSTARNRETNELCVCAFFYLRNVVTVKRISAHVLHAYNTPRGGHRPQRFFLDQTLQQSRRLNLPPGVRNQKSMNTLRSINAIAYPSKRPIFIFHCQNYSSVCVRVLTLHHHKHVCIA